MNFSALIDAHPELVAVSGEGRSRILTWRAPAPDRAGRDLIDALAARLVASGRTSLAVASLKSWAIDATGRTFDVGAFGCRSMTEFIEMYPEVFTITRRPGSAGDLAVLVGTAAATGSGSDQWPHEGWAAATLGDAASRRRQRRRQTAGTAVSTPAATATAMRCRRHGRARRLPPGSRYPCPHRSPTGRPKLARPAVSADFERTSAVRYRRLARLAPRTSGDTMTDWNLADIYEAVAAKVPDRPCQVQGEPGGHVGQLRPAGQRPRRRPARRPASPTRARWRPTSTTAPSTSRPTSPRSRAASPRSTRTTATAPTRSSTCSTTPTPRPWSSTPPSPTCSRRSATSCPRCGAGTWWPTRPATAPSGRCPTSPSWPAAPTGSSAPWGRSGDDLLLLYTGGTTGMPKGVMWRQDDLFNVLGAGGNALLGVPPAADVDELVAGIDPAVPGMTMLSACPLMHGTGQFSSLVRHEPRRRGRRRCRRASSAPPSCGARWSGPKANSIVIVGPGLRRADARRARRPSRARYDLSSVFLITSSGVMWSQENKDGLLRHMPQAHPVRLVRLVRGGRPRRLGQHEGRGPGDGQVPARRDVRGVHRRRPAGRAGLRRAGHGGRSPASSRSATTRTRPRPRRRSARSRAGAGACPATGPRSSADGTLQAARPRLGVHQHRRREGVPRGGRGGAEDAPGRARRRGRRAPRRALRRGDHRGGRDRRSPTRSPSTCWRRS